jgi:hypothetical protein
MRKILSLLLISAVSACGPETPTSLRGLCDGTKKSRADLAADLAVTTDEAALVSGDALISQIDAACA